MPNLVRGAPGMVVGGGEGVGGGGGWGGVHRVQGVCRACAGALWM